MIMLETIFFLLKETLQTNKSSPFDIIWKLDFSVFSKSFSSKSLRNKFLIFLLLIYLVFKKLYLEKNDKIKLILVGSISIILFQVLIHIGVNIRLFPTTGMTLPFLSYGGSSIIGTSILVGIILNFTSRKIDKLWKKKF